MKHVPRRATIFLFFFVTLAGVSADTLEVMPYGGAGWVFTAGVANTATAMLNRINSGNVLGIFCSNEGTARAVLAATPTTAAFCPRSIPASW
jgi:hypothetical protein